MPRAGAIKKPFLQPLDFNISTTLLESNPKSLVASFGLKVEVVSRVPDQEFRRMDFADGEGSCAVIGQPSDGLAYVELGG